MSGETDLRILLKDMEPYVNDGEYVFVSVENKDRIPGEDALGIFKEREGVTLILERQKADSLQLKYHFIASWITLKIHSSLEAVGLTAAFSRALAKHNISCNVIAGYYHDHIFVAKKDESRAIKVLSTLSNNS